MEGGSHDRSCGEFRFGGEHCEGAKDNGNHFLCCAERERCLEWTVGFTEQGKDRRSIRNASKGAGCSQVPQTAARWNPQTTRQHLPSRRHLLPERTGHNHA